MGVIWEWLGEGEFERSVEVTPILSSNEESFGGGVVHEEYEGSERHSFSARGLTWAEVSALLAAAKVRESQQTIVDKLGRSFVGYMTKLNWRNINGTVYWEVTASLLIPPTEPS
jgi:hypothetical protein